MAKTINNDQNETVNAIGVIITIIIVLVYIITAYKQNGFLKRGTERLQVLAMRGETSDE